MKKDKNMDNVIIFNNKHLRNKEQENDIRNMDDVYMSMTSDPKDLQKVWSHDCPDLGKVVLMDSVCPRCLKTKPTGGEE